MPTRAHDHLLTYIADNQQLYCSLAQLFTQYLNYVTFCSSVIIC